jgi:phosphate transport system substrate-binding protein
MTRSRLPKFLSQCTTIAVAMSVLAGAGFAAEITGAGSTFVYPILFKWSMTYSTQTGNKINYQSIGSGGVLHRSRRRQ